MRLKTKPISQKQWFTDTSARCYSWSVRKQSWVRNTKYIQLAYRETEFTYLYPDYSFTGIEDQKFCLDVPRSSRVLSKQNDFIEMEQNSGTIVQRSSAYSTQHGWKSTNLTMADQGNYTCFGKVIFLNLTGNNLIGPRM